jgi:U3 small nucleolar RNA-associated protein 14
MPPRISRSSLTTNKPKSAKARSRKRTLDAFSIAAAEEPQESGIRAKRLGELADGPSKKRPREASEEIASDIEDEDAPRRRRMKPSIRKTQDDVSEESDSDGNRWQLGHVGEENDTDIDSDEAFDSEDEERFAHFSFSASTSKGVKRKSKQRGKNKTVDLQEDQSMDECLDEDDSLGEDAVDLAQMLDDYSEDEERSSDQRSDGSSSDDADDRSASSEDDEDDAFLESSEDEDVDGEQLGKLQSLVTSLHPAKDDTKKRTADLYNSQNPSAAGPATTEKFDIRDLFNSADPQLAKMSRKLGNLPKPPKKDPKLAPSLPKLQKDKIDRAAANEKANRTLERWVNSVKHMRRAEHVQFPLQDPEKDLPREPEHLLPAISTKPLNALESTVNHILLESGLAPVEDEESGDELPDNGVTVEEVLARRAELRRARDLVFREEKKAKRIKKIKSKSYRRVHRKERERLAALEEGSEMDEEDREAHDRRRAEERMGAKHRDSKWAKQMKKSGRSIWDEEARSGVTEMARRGDELRKRIAGKMDGTGSNDDSDSSSEEADADHDDEEAEERYLSKTLDVLRDDSEGNDKGSKLSSMKFMQKAAQALKVQNEEALERLRREMNGEESSEDSDAENIGRKIFGPSDKMEKRKVEESRNEFEEPNFSGAEEYEDESAPLIDPTGQSGTERLNTSTKLQSKQSEGALKPSKTKKPTKQEESVSMNGMGREILSKPDADGWVTVTYEYDSNEEGSDNDKESLISQTEILRRAFAGDDVEDDFEKEKEGVVADEDEQIIDNTMAGWGSWVGEGISKRELKRAKGKVLSKQEGIKPENRKDAKLKNVIINHKRVRKNVDYLASTLPFPYNSRAEYERSIRMPIGTEWNVKQTYQENTKPRVLVKPGAIVTPMEKPLV